MAATPSVDSDNSISIKGALAHGTFLGVSKSSLEQGPVRKLAFFGALLLGVAFLIPISIRFQQWVWPWDALPHVSAIPLLFPLMAILMGVVAWLGPLHPWQRSTVLLLAGIIGLLTLPWLGSYSGSPSNPMPLLTMGLVVGTWGIILRCLHPMSGHARSLLGLAAILTITAFLIPTSRALDSLPIELAFFVHDDIGKAMPLTTYLGVFNRAPTAPTVLFSTMYLLLPILLVPAAALLARRKPKGAWDSRGRVLRPIAWTLFFYVPLGYALYTFNIFGDKTRWFPVDGYTVNGDDFRSALIAGRLRLMLLAAVFSAWATWPIVGAATWLDEARTKTLPVTEQ